MSGKMIVISRITTVYDEVEDRVSLTGEAQSGEIYRGWLTHRLFDRLLERLFGILSKAADDGFSAVLNEFAQDRAEAELSPTVPVQPKQESRTLGPYLITEIDIAELDGAVQLSFRHSADAGAIIPLAHQDLRQWLAIVRTAYKNAGWPMQTWPDWMSERNHDAAARPVLH
jgi:hypothetical protein